MDEELRREVNAVYIEGIASMIAFFSLMVFGGPLFFYLAGSSLIFTALIIFKSKIRTNS